MTRHIKMEKLDRSKLPEILKIVAGVSTAHLTRRDARILDGSRGSDAFSFIGRSEAGYFLEPWPPRFNEEALESRYSESLCRLANALHAAGFYYVAFDRDAGTVEGFGMFEW